MTYDPRFPKRQYATEPNTTKVSVCEIPLTRGYVALVDPEDFERFGHLKWAAMPMERSATIYARRSVWGDDGVCRTILLHREIMGNPNGLKVDHRDRDGLNCRRRNLRVATNSQNTCNRIQRNTRPGLLGVQQRSATTWRGQVKLQYRVYYTKTFKCPLLAAHARDELARQLHGEFCVENFPQRQTNSPHLAAASAVLAHALANF
jgi:hypothetical protein